MSKREDCLVRVPHTPEHVLPVSVHDTGPRLQFLAAQEVGECDGDGVGWPGLDGLRLSLRHAWAHPRWRRSRLSLGASLRAALGTTRRTTALSLLLLHLLDLGHALGLDVLDELRDGHAMLLCFGGELDLHLLDLLRRGHRHPVGTHWHPTRSSWTTWPSEPRTARPSRPSRSPGTSIWVLHSLYRTMLLTVAKFPRASGYSKREPSPNYKE